MSFSTLLTYTRPSIVDSIVTCYKTRGALVQDDYNEAFLHVAQTVAAVVGLTVFVQFGSKLGGYKYIAAALTAAAFPGVATKLPFVTAMYLSGKGAATAAKAKAWDEVAKNIGLALAAAVISATATQVVVKDFTRNWI
jgi:hypothetical protein